MGPILQRADGFAPWLSPPAVGVLALAAVAAWVGLHWLAGLLRAPASPGRLGRGAWLGVGLFGLRVVAGTVALWLAMQALARVMVLATPWRLWWPALLGAGLVEGAWSLYRLERRKLARRLGLALAALRVAAVVLLAFVLTQPVLSRQKAQKRVRVIAVLLDESASMGLVDRQWTSAEKVRLARLFGEDFDVEPADLAGAAAGLRWPGRPLISEADRLDALAHASAGARTVAKHVTGRGEALRKAIDQARDALAEADAQLGAVRKGRFKTGPELRSALGDFDRRLKQAAGSLGKADHALGAALEAARSDPGAPEMLRRRDALRAGLRTLQAEMAQCAERLRLLAPEVDRAFTASLPGDLKRRIDQAADLTRQAVARHVLARAKDGLLGRMTDKYVVRLYRFAREPIEVPSAKWPKAEGRARKARAADPRKTSGPTPDSAADAWRGATDLQSALARVRKDVASDELAGVLLVTDGQHNAAASIEEAGRRLGAQGAPVCSILVGCEEPPIDAAVTAVRAATTVFLGDRARFKVALKMDSLAGKDVKVRLRLGEELLDAKTVTVPQDRHREEVRFSHRPKKIGPHRYRVEIDECLGETVVTNNRYDVDVSVSDDRTKLLIVDGRPRWEFRYLRSLFSGRDRSVFLQFVLLRPDRLAGVTTQEKIHASVDRPFLDPKATALPETPADWLKFDVIVLGDVSPGVLGAAELQTLRRFVVQRGGALVVICGRRFMPHAYAPSLWGDLLPLTYAHSPEPLSAPPEPAYRLRLTPEGRAHAVMRQRDDPLVNLGVWGRLPKLYWRHPVTGAKEGATVLAYAEPVSPDPGADAPAPDTAPPPARADRGAAARAAQRSAASQSSADEAAARRQARRERALIATHRVGRGRVIFLAFDHTWRLRYRVGDARHHRFWGQLLRWAGDDKLRSGTDRVRLGTDRLVYNPTQPLIVKAKVLDRKRNPVTGGKVIASLYRDEELLDSKALSYVKNSNGYYEAEMPRQRRAGRYRIELSGETVAEQLAGGPASTVDTQVLVVVPVTGEMMELAADRTVLARLATLSGGAVATPESAEKLLPAFGPGSGEFRERRDTSLWDSWPVLVLILLAAGAEWVIRKKEGLT